MLPREIIKKVKRIELVTRRLVNPQLAGQYHSVFKGRGMDFDEVQPYVAGDEIRFIDWNVSARSGSLYVKRFVEERELTVQIVVDASSSMAFGSRTETKRTVAAQVAAVLAVLATRNNDRVGLTVFDDEVDLHIAPRKGRKHVMRLITEILGHRPRQSRTDIGGALQYVTRVTSRRAIVFVLSDFLAEGWEHELKILARRHDVVPVIVEDPRELAPADEPAPRGWLGRLTSWLDGGLLAFDDLESGRTGWFDAGSARHRRRWSERVERRAAERDRIFQRLRLDTMRFSTAFESETDYVRPLALFFRRRSRRH